MAKYILLTASEEGYLYFDTGKCWFCFCSKDETIVDPVSEIATYRNGNFDLTAKEVVAMRLWLRENLKDGIFQN